MDQDNKDCNLDMGRGCEFCRCTGSCGTGSAGCCNNNSENGSESGGQSGEMTATAVPGCYKLHSYDWLEGMPDVFPDNIFEVRFKNTRKGFYRNENDLPLKMGDIVAVEASPGHDIGIISLTGDMVARQMRRMGFNPQNGEFKKIYRKAKPYDIEKWQEAIGLEHQTMIRSRQIAAELGLDMKIGDVEYQGDKVKAIFYYIADERVDFRELIKIFAGQFRIRIEMKQIGARQEAGRIGGLGSCGRQLCCASWISSFVSVTTNAARSQEISLNPQKLAGQCSKLKCCLVYELDTYLDARREFPRLNGPLQTIDGDYYLVKLDILSRTMWFSPDPHVIAGMRPLGVERVKEILRLNSKGKKADQLTTEIETVQEPTFADGVGEDSLTRFDSTKKNRSGKNRKRGGERGERGGERGGEQRGERGGEQRGERGERSGEQHNRPGGNGERSSGERSRGERSNSERGERGGNRNRGARPPRNKPSGEGNGSGNKE